MDQNDLTFKVRFGTFIELKLLVFSEKFQNLVFSLTHFWFKFKKR